MFRHVLEAFLGTIAAVGSVSVLSLPVEHLSVLGESRVLIQVGKTGVLGLAGHAHEVEAPVTGHVTLDRLAPQRSEVVLEFETGSLRITGRGEPARDVPEVQRVMLSDRVVDAARYPKIVFRSTSITGVRASGDSITASVTGDLLLHGTTRSVVVPVRARLSEGSITVEGTVTLKQTDFGMQPVTAAGGTIRVRDEVEIGFRIKAGQ